MHQDVDLARATWPGRRAGRARLAARRTFRRRAGNTTRRPARRRCRARRRSRPAGVTISSAFLQRMAKRSILQIGLVEALRFVVLARVRLHHAHAGKSLLHDDHELPGFVFLARAGAAHFLADDQHRQQAEREDDEGEQRERQSVLSSATSAERIEIGCLTMSPAIWVSACCAMRVWLKTVCTSSPAFARLKNSSDCASRCRKSDCADVVEHAQAHPEHAVGVQIGEQPARWPSARECSRRSAPLPRCVGRVRADLGQLRNPASAS